MSAYASLTHALAEALVDVLRFVEGCEDEEMDQDDAVRMLEWAGHILSRLSDEQRGEFLDLLGKMAEEESDPARRAFLREFPEGFGLVEEPV
ncbi:hypothetical protein [Streptomyces virginiae]|uniref:hypothetical protein n=1 Tax=Streptomyces virginiae TaxID=1961 RepID=UPI002257FBFF|nr:hypothetical protein [Streptomyces virginiae]MCX4960907.1 hypothetical protein [Streptomyces virginiae]